MKKRGSLSEKTVDPDPFTQFYRWYREHSEATPVYPDSFSLGTASGNGRVSVRTVLLKEYDRRGFVFFTNYNSLKGEQLVENPSAAMLFYWPESSRQVRIEGRVEKISGEESTEYYHSRPRQSRIGVWASTQSKKIPGRDYLEKRFADYTLKFTGRQVPRPQYWGGYRIVPDRFEFWQEGLHRLHDRIIYLPSDGSWRISRLSP
jgi:pyridoxamine 5'-phosphate oxidase